MALSQLFTSILSSTSTGRPTTAAAKPGSWSKRLMAGGLPPSSTRQSRLCRNRDRRKDPSSMSSRLMTTEPHTVLFGWARTGDEDVYQSSGALLPITAGAYIGNADHRSKQIGGVNISSHIAALFRALHQLFDCS